MTKCLFCDSEKIEHTCEKCGSSFCVNHILTTEQWYCKKHEDVQFSKARAQESNYRCPVIEDSECPECRSLLMLNRLSSGQFYLKCTNCSWNSYLKTPGLFFPSEANLAREAKRFGLLKKGWDKCNKKLKNISGKELCPKCFLDLLRRAPVTNFSTIMNAFNITAEKMVKFIKKFLEEERIYGVIDQKNRMFYYISAEMRNQIVSKIQDKGKIKVSDLALMLDMDSEMTLQVLYKIIGQFQIKGTFTIDKKIYYSQKYLMENLKKKIKDNGRAKITNLSREFNIPADLLKNFCINLMRTKEVRAYFADRGKEVLTINQLRNEIIAFAKKSGLFKLTKLADNLNIAQELARKSLHELIKSGTVEGLFTQKREFMTKKYLDTKIKELARAYRNMTLRELSNRLAITEASIEENLAILIGRGEIDGYIDSQKRLFVAYSVPTTSNEKTQIKKQTVQHKDEDKIEVLRDYDFEGGQLHFKVAVRNNSNMAINNVKVLLDAPSSYTIKQPLINIPVIEKNNSRGVDFYLEPKECGKSTIAGTVIYKNAQGDQRSLLLRPKEVQIKCPLVCTSLSTIEDCQLSIQDLPNDARAFLIADLDPRLAYRAAIRALKYFDTSMVTSYEGGDTSETYEAEAWFCAEAKVTGGRIITRIYISAASQSLEVRVWCSNQGQLTGFLARIIELLMEEIGIIRKIKSEEREKTIDVMAITQNLAEISDYCMLKWKAQNIRTKLHDTFVRLRKLLKEDSAVLGRIEFWLTRLNKYEKDENISDEDADKLVNDVENFRSVLTRTLKI
ncbi:MAG: DUF2042 domain-containing protein [Candidatus Lokiarchaeota archaeon]|nr:DUF2042 domain-containing protein [Candidatus Lokiarchaeota archaeon]MBD3343194.1 DUF2042 domain-containing protein [Candidatus Lokiarchaeota archaeon]